MDAEIQKPLIYCAACRHSQLLSGFRRLCDEPLLYSDFCRTCETKHGVLALYQDRNMAYVTSPDALKFIREHEDYASQAEEEAQTSLETAEKEMARRELMRRRLIYYVTQFRPDYLAGWVHQDICRRLERFVRRSSARRRHV